MTTGHLFRPPNALLFAFIVMCATSSAHSQTLWQTTRAVPVSPNAVTTYVEVITGPSIGPHLHEFLALGGNGPILEFIASVDGGVTWQQRGSLPIIGGTTGGSFDVFKLAYGPEGYTLVNTSDFCNPSSASGHTAQTCMWRSTNTMDWEPVPLSTSLQNFYSITYGNGRYAVVGEQGFGPCMSNGAQDARSRCHISISTNGVTWNDELPNAQGITGISDYRNGPLKFLNGRFIFDGYSGMGTGSDDTRFWSSADGITWTATSNRFGSDTCTFSHGVAYGNSRYLVFSLNPDFVCVSADAVNWSKHPIVGTNKPMSNSSGLIFFAGTFYSLIRHASQQVPRSIGGYSWVNDITDPSSRQAIAADDEHAVQVGIVEQAGRGFLYASSDRIFASGMDNE